MTFDSVVMSHSDLWKVAHETLQAAYNILSLYEGKDYVLVEKALNPMRDLIIHGKDYEAMKAFNADTTIPSTSHQNQQYPIRFDELFQTYSSKPESSDTFVAHNSHSEEVESSYTDVTSNSNSVSYAIDDTRLFSNRATTESTAVVMTGTGDVKEALKKQTSDQEDSFNLDMVGIEENLPRGRPYPEKPSASQLLYTPFDFKQDLNTTPTFVDSIGLVDERSGPEMIMFNLTKPEHLDTINIPPEGFKYTVTISYQFFINRFNRETMLKALGLYVSTGEAYTVLVEQACLLRNRDTIKHTKLGYLLTHPSVRRICWYPGRVQSQMIKQLGFPIESCIDLSVRANYEHQNNKITFSLGEAINHFLMTWDDKYKFFEIKAEYERDIKSKHNFNESLWDRTNPSSTAMTYNSLLGLATHFLYFQTLKKIKAEPKLFFYNYEQ